ncbi:AcrR family transcriptional regulator [Paenibacillus anaericanus]|uniref:TetR/AcrR family transcriptional regulator n=1 Tax=Paenibacillus anaericanus TaxID=170367 RepID=UPI0027856801|nr:TetR/AcrR family transcriptional regulator [Paenibacillus anaericanus]MDQ0091180.1 AcrR family transcriptional regulator [Paenibacillus anaericanus]
MQVNPTKLMIQQTALELFAVHGYNAVSIRDIGKIIGIKESTIYYHYESKQDILNHLLGLIEELITTMKAAFNNQFSQIDSVGETEFVGAAVHFLNRYFLEDHVLKCIRMLFIEKQSNPKAADLYRNLIFTMPLEHQSQVFTQMVVKGFFREDDADQLAMEYHSLVYSIFQKHCGGCEVQPSDIDSANRELAVLIQRFYRRYIVT